MGLSKGRLMPVMHVLVSNFPQQAITKYRNIRHFVTFFGALVTSVPTISVLTNWKLDIQLLLMALIFFHLTISWTALAYAIDIHGMIAASNAYCWSIDCAGPQIRQKILKRAAFEDRLALVASLLEILGLASAVAHPDFLARMDRCRLALRSHLPGFDIVVVALFIVWLISSVPAIVTFPCCFYYFNWQQQFQAELFAGYLKDMLEVTPSDFLPSLRANITADDYYQGIIWHRLKRIIRRHEELIKIFHVRMQLLSIRVISIMFGLSGGSLAITCCFNIMIGESVVTSVFLFSVIMLYLEMMSSATQGYEDSHELMFYAALMVPWYEWNAKNKQAYLLLVQQLSQWVPYKFFNVRVNRSFQVKFLEKVYAAFTILLKVNRD